MIRKVNVSAHRRRPPRRPGAGGRHGGAGCCAAPESAGRQVTVIEARERIGGRTFTSHLWPDLPVDMGASWIHGTKGNPLTALARRRV